MYVERAPRCRLDFSISGRFADYSSNTKATFQGGSLGSPGPKGSDIVSNRT